MVSSYSSEMKNPAESVPRDGVEPPTRGFSILAFLARFAEDSRGRRAARSRTEAAALLALALAGCLGGEVTVEGGAPPDPPAFATYVAELDVETPPGANEVEAVAACDEGDRVLAGGCAWGEVEGPHDPPLRPLVDAPADTGDGWVCRGQNTGVGVELKTVRASAVCMAGGS
jgi:hypothetical protein